MSDSHRNLSWLPAASQLHSLAAAYLYQRRGYLYQITCAREVVICTSEVVTYTREVIICTRDVVTCNKEVVTCTRLPVLERWGPLQRSGYL